MSRRRILAVGHRGPAFKSSGPDGMGNRGNGVVARTSQRKGEGRRRGRSYLELGYEIEKDLHGAAAADQWWADMRRLLRIVLGEVE